MPGVLIKNAVGEVVFDNDHDLLCEVGSGVSSGSAYHSSGAYNHIVTTAPGEFLAWELNNGRWIGNAPYFSSRDLDKVFKNGKWRDGSFGLISNASSIRYRRLKFGSDIPASGRYGLLIRRQGAARIFHSDMTLAWMADGATVDLSAPAFNAVTFIPAVAPDWVLAPQCALGLDIYFRMGPNGEILGEKLAGQHLYGAVRRSGGSLIFEVRKLALGDRPSATYKPLSDVSVSAGVLKR